ncbi:MAG TPA: DinB family protein [Longimicrobiales bacterium]|nr:DinB family protein [Longimicrobiales bacterium]
MSAFARDFARILGRDLDKVARHLEAYESDVDVWRVAGDTKNSAGTLALHIVGNLEHFIAGVLGNTGYARNRDAEFGDRDFPRDELIRNIAGCRKRVVSTLEGLSDAALQLPYPGKLPPHMEGASTHLFLLHLAVHLNWHLGQMDYHRRMLPKLS